MTAYTTPYLALPSNNAYVNGDTLTIGDGSVLVYNEALGWTGGNVIGTRDPVTGGNTISAGSSTLKLPAGAVTAGGAADKIRASIAAALNHNPQVSAPWYAAPTWTISTTYGAGQVVRGTGADAVNLYFMCGSTSTAGDVGTSAASGTGPSGDAVATGIADGTCRWVFLGKSWPTASTTLPLISTAKLAAATDLMTGLVQLIPAATATAIGLVGYTPTDLTTEMSVTGGLYAARDAGRVNSANIGTVAAPSYNVLFERPAVEFDTNAVKWVGLKAGTSIQACARYDITVNGRHICESQYSVPVGTSTDLVVLINMSAFGPGMKRVRVSVSGSLIGKLTSMIYLAKDDFIRPVENPNRFRIAFEGDSITACAGMVGDQRYNPRYWIEQIVADRIGCDSYYNNSVAGTGVVYPTAGGNAYIYRLPDLVAFAPDIVIIGGFRNSYGEVAGAYNNSANRKRCMLEYFRAIRAALPSCYIVVLGNQVLQDDSVVDSATTGVQVERDALTAFTAFGDTNSAYIPFLLDTKIRISNTVGRNFWGSGVAYGDSHPTPPYYQYTGALYARAIAKMFGVVG
jgi:hypothetical protein